jgi:hypothetical protein
LDVSIPYESFHVNCVHNIFVPLYSSSYLFIRHNLIIIFIKNKTGNLSKLASNIFLGNLTFSSLNKSSSLDKNSDSLHTVETRQNNEIAQH